MNKVIIELYDRNGELQSAGRVVVNGQRVSMAGWTFGGDHVLRRPLGLIRRLALQWVADGADRAYYTCDQTTFVTAILRPSN